MKCNLLILYTVMCITFIGINSVNAQITSKPCPYSCKTGGLSSTRCKDWRIGDTCYVQRLKSTTQNLILCLKTDDGSITVKSSCKTDGSEQRLQYSTLKGETGSTGPQGNTGSQGPTGADGVLRVYGDGSAGAKIFSSSTTFQESNPQFTDVTINSGVTLSIPSGTVIRCSGTFTNNGTIVVDTGLRDSPKFGENGLIVNSGSSSGAASQGGTGGGALPLGAARQTLRLGLLSGGNGHQERNDTGGKGGGNFTVICKGAIINNGIIRANGSSASAQYRGGGGGGFIILSSANSVSNNGSIEATGGNGGALLDADSNMTGYGPGGGGAGGIVHLISPSLVNSGSVSVSGGRGGAAGGAGAVTGILYFGGGGGGGSGGEGGQGGTVNPGNIGNGSTTQGEDGDAGQIFQTVADPSAYL